MAYCIFWDVNVPCVTESKAAPAVAKRYGTQVVHVNFENLTSNSEHSDRLNFILPDQATFQGLLAQLRPPSVIYPPKKPQSDHNGQGFCYELKASYKSGTYFIFPGPCHNPLFFFAIQASFELLHTSRHKKHRRRNPFKKKRSTSGSGSRTDSTTIYGNARLNSKIAFVGTTYRQIKSI